MQAHERIIVPLDNMSSSQALKVMTEIGPFVGLAKVGLELHHRMTAELYTASTLKQAANHLRDQRNFWRQYGSRTMWDGKFDDIPETVGNAMKAVADLNPFFCTVHASAGLNALLKAQEWRGRVRPLGVTVLTSFDDENCISIFGQSPEEKVMQFADLLLAAQVPGIVCSPKEITFLRSYDRYHQLTFVIPGIRPEWALANDQKRIMSPREAIAAGADYLVIGRPILAPPKDIGSPRDAIKLIVEEIEQGLRDREPKLEGAAQ
jgi:orotidine-5'-phosphate decarboxylase